MKTPLRLTLLSLASALAAVATGRLAGPAGELLATLAGALVMTLSVPSTPDREDR